MLSIKYIWESVTQDRINMPENGDMSFAAYNRMSRRGEMRLLDYLTGDVEGIKPPTMYTTQKLKSWLSPFIQKKDFILKDGFCEKPEDYYRPENMYNIVPSVDTGDCDAVYTGAANNKIEIVDGAEFSNRIQSRIIGLKPSMKRPICKEIGNRFEFEPKTIGAVSLEYIRYPKFGFIKTKMDTVYNNLVIDEAQSQDYEWPEYAAELLIWFITNEFAINRREEGLMVMNKGNGMLVRNER